MGCCWLYTECCRGWHWYGNSLCLFQREDHECARLLNSFVDPLYRVFSTVFKVQTISTRDLVVVELFEVEPS